MQRSLAGMLQVKLMFQHRKYYFRNFVHLSLEAMELDSLGLGRYLEEIQFEGHMSKYLARWGLMRPCLKGELQFWINLD